MNALTTGQDAAAGTEGNDTILGLVGTGATFTLGDVIDGKGGTDSLNLTSDNATVNMATATVSNVEVLDINADAAGTVNGDTISLNEVAYTSATIEGLAGADGGGDALAINGVNLSTRLILEDFTDVATTITFAGTTGTSDEATLELSDVNGTTATADETDVIIGDVETQNIVVSAASDIAHLSLVDATTVNITADAALILEEAVSFDAATALNITANDDVTLNNTADLAADAAITVSGAGDVDLDTLENTEITVDASAMTGGLTVTGAANTASISTGEGADDVTTGAITTDVTLGAGDDTFSTGGLDFGGATAVDVDAGAGTDTINVDDGAEFDTAAVAHFKNFEILDIGGGQDSYDADLIALEAVEVNADLAGAATITDLTDEAVRITATTTAALTLELEDASGSSDTQSFTIEGAAVDTGNDGDTSNDTNDLTVGAVVTAGIETVTAVSNTAATNEAGTQNILTLLDTDATKLIVTGNHALEIDGFDDGGAGTNATIKTIDASGSTAGLIMDDHVQTTNVSLIGSEVADTLVVGTVDGLNIGASTGSTINAGGGGDIIDLTDGLTIAGASATDTIIIESGDSQIGFTDTNDSGSYTAAADAESFDIVTGFESGDDTIDLGSFGFTGQKASGIAGVTLSEADALELVDGTTSTIADFFEDTGVTRGVAVASGGDYSDIGLSGTNDSLVFVDTNGNGDLDVGVDEMIGLSGTSAVALADFGF